MSKLVKLLKDLGRDASLAEAYSRNPEDVIGRYGLTDEEGKALRDRDLDAIKRITGLSDVHTSNGNIKAYD